MKKCEYQPGSTWASVSINTRINDCDGLYIIGPESDPIRRCGLVGVGVSLRVWA